MLLDLEPELRRSGVHVPVTGRRPRLARHAGLTGAMDCGESVAGGTWKEWLDEVRASNARQFVISDEMFVGWPTPRYARALAAVAEVAGLEVDVVGYVRPQWQYIEARYAEMVKHGYARWGRTPFDQYVAEALLCATVGTRRWFDYRSVFAPWRAEFGTRVTVVPLEPARVPGGVAGHFLGLLGVDGLGWVAEHRYNTRPGAKEVEVRRLTGAALAKVKPAVRAPRLMKRLNDLPRLLVPDVPFSGFTRVQALEVMEHLAPANRAFAREYGIDANGVLFREPVIDDPARPSIAQWHDLDAGEQRAVRDYVHRTVGVDPMPPGHRRSAPAHNATAPLGTWRWWLAWLTAPRFMLWAIGRVVRYGGGAGLRRLRRRS